MENASLFHGQTDAGTSLLYDFHFIGEKNSITHNPPQQAQQRKRTNGRRAQRTVTLKWPRRHGDGGMGDDALAVRQVTRYTAALFRITASLMRFMNHRAKNLGSCDIIRPSAHTLR